MKHLNIILAFLMTLSSPVTAQDFNKGVLAYNSGDYVTAIKEWMPLAEQGDADAQNNLGVMYENGYGTAQDYKKAAKWYRLAAEQGQGVAQEQLGELYFRGIGVLQDDEQAFKWYRRAAEQGNADAQNQLGNIYGLGKIVPQDYARSYMWFSIAAANGKKVAARLRTRVADILTVEELSEAKKLARKCMESNYKECG